MSRQTPESIRLHLASPAPGRVMGFADLKPEEIVGALASLPATVLVVDRQRIILAYSGQAQPGFVGGPGALPERILGQDMFDLVPEDHRAFYDTQLRRVLDGGEVVTFDVEGSEQK